MINLYYLQKVEIKTNTFSFNCEFHVLTCLTGLQNKNEAKNLWIMLNN